MDIDPRFKLLLIHFFREFLQLFLPDIAGQIDWRRSVEFLDKELQSILPDRRKGTVDVVGWALTGLMNVSAEDRARVKAEALRRVASRKIGSRGQAVA